LQPVVEQHASRLAAFAATRAVPEKIALAELHRAFGLRRHAIQPVEALVSLVMACQKALMSFAGIDDGLDLRVGQDAFRDQIARQPRHIERHRRSDEAIDADCTSMAARSSLASSASPFASEVRSMVAASRMMRALLDSGAALRVAAGAVFAGVISGSFK